MDGDKRVELSRMAAELFYLREAAKIAGEPFLAHLIGMAAFEAERLGGPPPEVEAEAPERELTPA